MSNGLSVSESSLDFKQVKEIGSKAWDERVVEKVRWTIPVSPEEIAAAREGKINILITPIKSVPMEWMGKIKGSNVLCLASGGGQQGPLFAAAGANVTVVDYSVKQLEQDKFVADRENLDIKLLRTPADDLSAIPDESIDLIINPVSNCYFPDLDPVWKECSRVLKKNGRMIYGINQPLLYCFDEIPDDAPQDVVIPLKHSYPRICAPSAEDPTDAYEFSHSWETQISGLCKYGMVITGMYEDYWGKEHTEVFDQYFPCFLSILARKVTIED